MVFAQRLARRAQGRVLFSVLLSRGRFGPLGLHGNSRAAFGLIAAKGGGPGSNLCGSSKPPSLQTSKLRALARRPSLCSSVTLREPLCSSVIGGSPILAVLRALARP